MKLSLPRNFEETMPRIDYPSPQWARSEWYCLNGSWEFAYDHSRSGEARGMAENGEFPLTINVPFCPESKLSGIGNTDFIAAVWYRTTLRLDTLSQGRALLHFGAVDYLAKIWVNGIFCGSHKGGYTSFFLDITHALREGENVIVVYAEDDLRGGLQPCGKQSNSYGSNGCSYTRTTGIWQTVWLEFVPERYLVTAKMTPHAADGCLDVQASAFSPASGDKLRLSAYYQGKKVGEAEACFVGNLALARIAVSELHLWEVGAPELYDLTLELIDGSNKTVDAVQSYFALRDISFNKTALTVNGKQVFMRLILDQGFNPDGIYTAPDAEYLKKDIELSLDLGFNGARFHQRVFEPRSLYEADRLGYMVWVEFPVSIRSSLESMDATLSNFLPEWVEIVNSHYNHPSVVGWIPFNETYHCMKMSDYFHELFYTVTKEMDAYRPTIDASGGVHFKTDLFDTHDYEQDVEIFRQHYEKMREDDQSFYSAASRYRGKAPCRDDVYEGQAFWVSEYGGTLWNPELAKGGAGWGYGSTPKSEDELAERYVGLTDVMLSHPRICGFCYTQLTDIEQEQNGLYYYDRTKKFSESVYDRIRAINKKIAEIEK